MSTKQHDTRAYKLDVREVLKRSGTSKAVLERELGLYTGQIRSWQTSLQRDGQEALPETGRQTETEAKLRRLRRENDILRQARAALV